MKKSAQIPRCGCCDSPNVMFLCEDCGEPTCAEHMARIGEPGSPTYLCSICAAERRELAEQEAADAPAVIETGVLA